MVCPIIWVARDRVNTPGAKHDGSGPQLSVVAVNPSLERYPKLGWVVPLARKMNDMNVPLLTPPTQCPEADASCGAC
jgi:hypothetical protein